MCICWHILYAMKLLCQEIITVLQQFLIFYETLVALISWHMIFSSEWKLWHKTFGCLKICKIIKVSNVVATKVIIVIIMEFDGHYNHLCVCVYSHKQAVSNNMWSQHKHVVSSRMRVSVVCLLFSKIKMFHVTIFISVG